MSVRTLLFGAMLSGGSGLHAAELSRSANFVVGAVVVDTCELSRSLRRVIVQRQPAAARACSSDYVDTSAVAEPVTAITLAKDGTITAIRLEF